MSIRKVWRMTFGCPHRVKEAEQQLASRKHSHEVAMEEASRHVEASKEAAVRSERAAASLLKMLKENIPQ